jgi:hypothetical protein
VLAWHPATRNVAVVEVKSVIPDVQAMIFAIDRKARVAPIVARERGWACSAVGRFLFVAEARTARRRVARHASIFDAAFPVRNRDALAWLSNPIGPPPSALVFVTPSGTSVLSHSRPAGMRRAMVRPPRPSATASLEKPAVLIPSTAPDSRPEGI